MGNMNGSISYSEFEEVLRKRLNLRFEESLLRQIMKEFDDTGSGELDYRKFCELVMGSKKTSASSLAIGGPKGHVSADSGNSEMMIRRKVHLSFKPLKFAFADVQDAQGTVVFEDVRTILQRFDIDLTDEQFKVLGDKVGLKNVGGQARILWAGVMRHYTQEEDDY